MRRREFISLLGAATAAWPLRRAVNSRASARDDSTNFTGLAQFGVIQAMAPALGVEMKPVDLRDASEIESTVLNFARSSAGGLIIAASGLDHQARNTCYLQFTSNALSLLLAA